MTLMMPTKLPRIMIYLEPELKEAAERIAKKERRSVSSLFVRLLEEAIRDDEKKEKSAN